MTQPSAGLLVLHQPSATIPSTCPRESAPGISAVKGTADSSYRSRHGGPSGFNSKAKPLPNGKVRSEPQIGHHSPLCHQPLVLAPTPSSVPCAPFNTWPLKPVGFRCSPHKARRAAHLQMLLREENTRVIVFPQTHVHPEPQSVTSFGNKVFADVIKMRSHWVRLSPMTGVLVRGEDTRRGGGRVKMRQTQEPRIWGAPRTGGDRKEPPQSPRREHGPATP